MTGDELRQAREAKGWTQAQLGEALGKDRKTVNRWEGKDHELPEDFAAQCRAALDGRPLPITSYLPLPDRVKVAPVKVERKPKMQIEDVPLVELAAEAEAEVLALTDNPPPHLRGQKARRPTAAEVKAFPHRFAGPNVWVVEFNPPRKANAYGATVRLEVHRFSASGHGWPSVLLIGSRSPEGANPDREALAVYRPFRPALGDMPYRGKGPAKGRQASA